MKRIISIFTAVIIILGCLPLMSYAASADEETVYTQNTDEVYFSSAYAKVGEPISVKVKSGETELIYKWYIDNEQICNYGESYTPVEADIESMLTAEVYTADGELLGSANMLISLLPVMYIETENREDIVSKETTLRAHMTLQGNDEFNSSTVLYDGEMDIKGRGNSTWAADKKPYKIKLDSKTNLLGMGKNKHWVLLSNPYDSSLLRDKLLYELAEDMGLDTMSSQWVDVVLNGKVVGNYLLCEHIRIGDTRVNITDWDSIAEDAAKAIYNANKKTMTKTERDELAELMEADMNWVTDDYVTFNGKTYTVSDYYEVPSTNGGYLLEAFTDKDTYFTSQAGYNVSVSKPEGIGQGMLNEISEYYSAFEAAALSDDFCTQYNGKTVRYSDLADLDSLAKYMLINELFQNQDSFYRSFYMYKDVDGKLIFGPVWDLDCSSDNDFSYSYSHNKWIITDRVFLSNLKKDPAFVQALYNAYREYRYTAIEDLVKPDGDIDSAFNKIYESGINNDKIWNNSVSFEDNTNNFKLWLSRRLNWVDAQMTSVETLYASLNGSALNNSGASTLSLNGSQLTITSDYENVAEFSIYVNGEKLYELPFENNVSVNLDSLAENSVVSVLSYDSNGNYVGMSTVTNYNYPKKLTIVNKPDKLTYTAGETIDLTGLELNAVFSDGTTKKVEPEAVLSYVSDSLGSQALVYNKITDAIGDVYISLRYQGASVDFKVTRTANEDYDKVIELIDSLPQNNIADNLDVIFEAKQEYDALSEDAKKLVSNADKLDEAMAKVDKLADESSSPIIGCYIDKLGRIGKKNKIVIVTKGEPNKLRIFYGGSTTTFIVSDRNSCIAEKKIGDYTLITVINQISGDILEIGAYFNHILRGELYKFDAPKAVDNRSHMIEALSCPKELSSQNQTAELKFTLNDRVEKVKAVIGDKEITATSENNTAALNLTFDSSGTKNIKISYYADGEWHSYKDLSIYVREEQENETYFAVKYPESTAYDEAQVYVAVSEADSVKLVSDSEEINLAKVEKNGLNIWQGTVNTGTDQSYKVYVDSEDTGKTVSIEKLEKLLIKDGVLVECRVDSGEINVPIEVTSVADGAFDGFTGTIYCYRDSAVQSYAEKNGISYINYGYTLNISSDLTMNVGDKQTVNPTANPIFAPDFDFTLSSSNDSVVSVSGNTFEAVKSGYARVTITSNDGMIDDEIRVFIGGGCTKGDVNGDGKINSFDALLILQNSVGYLTLTDEEAEAADIDNSGKINSYDALIALKISTQQSSIWDYIK